MEPSVTIVSILPYEIYDSKPNLYPGNFTIPAGNAAKPGLLEIERSTFHIPMAFGAPPMRAHSSPFEVATSVVNDYVGALLSVGPDTKPGVWVEDKTFKNSALAAVQLAEKIAEVLIKQQKWFFSLVNLADAEYNKHKNAMAISDFQKMAARELNLKDKPWLLDMSQLAINNCPACYAAINANAIICSSCRYVIKPELYDSKKFAVETRAQ